MKAVLTDDYMWMGQAFSASPEPQEIPDSFAIALGLNPDKPEPAKKAPAKKEEE